MFTSPCMISNDSCKQTIKFLIAILSFQPWLLIRQNCHVLKMAWLIDQRYFSISFWIKATVTSPYRSNVNRSKQDEKMNKLFSFNSGNSTEKKHEKLSTLYLRNGFGIGPVTLNTVQIFKSSSILIKWMLILGQGPVSRKSRKYLKLYCKKQSNQKLTEFAVILKNFYSSNLLCICPSLLETNLNKAKYNFYEKLSRVFSVADSRFEEK